MTGYNKMSWPKEKQITGQFRMYYTIELPKVKQITEWCGMYSITKLPQVKWITGCHGFLCAIELPKENTDQQRMWNVFYHQATQMKWITG